jgi:hypothetical protein
MRPGNLSPTGTPHPVAIDDAFTFRQADLRCVFLAISINVTGALAEQNMQTQKASDVRVNVGVEV